VRLHKYAFDLLHRANMENCRVVTTPMSSTKKFSRNLNDPLSSEDAFKYRSVALSCHLLSTGFVNTCHIPLPLIMRKLSGLFVMSRALCLPIFGFKIHLLMSLTSSLMLIGRDI
jgi:hypothetical protein